MTAEYIGIKRVTAWEEISEDGAAGYAVRYSDGYTSWCPAEQFEEANVRVCDDAGIASLHPGVQGLLKFFAFEHLPDHLKAVSRPFAMLARITASGPQSAETTAALRKLLEAKDCAVRAALE